MEKDEATATLADVARQLEARGENELASQIRSAIKSLGPPEVTPPRRDLFTSGEAGRLLGGRSINTVKRWAASGSLEGVAIGTRLHITRRSLEDLQRRLGIGGRIERTDNSPAPTASPLKESETLALEPTVNIPDRPCPLHPGRQTSHPLFTYYGPASWPKRRILVIGYEPGGDLCMHEHAGETPLPFDAPAAAKVQFWTKSHLAISWAAEICGLSLWPKVVRARSSPIAYTDANPHGAQSGQGMKLQCPDEEELTAHASRLLKLPETQPDRCPVVVISRSDGAHADRYRAFYDVVEREFRGRGTRVVVAPFFGMQAKAEFIGKGIAVDRDVQRVIHDVVSEWGFREKVIERRADGKVVLKKHKPCKLCT